MILLIKFRFNGPKLSIFLHPAKRKPHQMRSDWRRGVGFGIHPTLGFTVIPLSVPLSADDTLSFQWTGISKNGLICLYPADSMDR